MAESFDFAKAFKDIMSSVGKVNEPMLTGSEIQAQIRERERLKAEEEARLRRLAEQEALNNRMLSSGGSDGNKIELSEEQKAMFDWIASTPEGKAFNEERMGNIATLFGLGLPVGMYQAATKGLPDINFKSMLGLPPQDFRNWQEQQRQQSQAYINQSIDAIQRESALQQLATNPFYQGSYTPSGNADSYTPQDSSGNISWGGQTYSSEAYDDLMP